MTNPNFEAISKIISLYLQKSTDKNFDLNLFIEQQNTTPNQLQKTFKKWIGIEPKVFLTYTSTNYTKSRLSSLTKPTLFDLDIYRDIENEVTVEIIPFSTTSDTIEIQYSYYESLFGWLIIASTSIGICFVSFIKNKFDALQELISEFPNCSFVQEENELHYAVLDYFVPNSKKSTPLKVHLKGTPFQLQVWHSLLKIPKGQLSSYGLIASTLNQPNASRAVGTAIGKNPIAIVIPCHRVVQKSGKWGGYRWSIDRKAMLIAWEAAIK